MKRFTGSFLILTALLMLGLPTDTNTHAMQLAATPNNEGWSWREDRAGQVPLQPLLRSDRAGEQARSQSKTIDDPCPIIQPDSPGSTNESTTNGKICPANPSSTDQAGQADSSGLTHGRWGDAGSASGSGGNTMGGGVAGIAGGGASGPAGGGGSGTTSGLKR